MSQCAVGPIEHFNIKLNNVFASTSSFMTCLSVYVCVTHRIVAAGPKLTKLAFNVSIPKWDPEEKLLSDHWPVSVKLKCPDKRSKHVLRLKNIKS